MARSLRVLSQPLADIKDFACLDDKAAIIQALKEVHFIRPEQSNSINKSQVNRYLRNYFEVRKQIGLPKKLLIEKCFTSASQKYSTSFASKGIIIP